MQDVIYNGPDHGGSYIEKLPLVYVQNIENHLFVAI